MKQILFTSILIFAFCFVISAQGSSSPCRKIIIFSPTNISPGDRFSATAHFENSDSPALKLDWTIINGEKITKKSKAEIIEVTSENSKDTNQIIVLANYSESDCENTAMAKVSIVPACGLPYTIDEYGKISWEDEKARLENVVLTMENSKDLELFAFFEFDKKTPQATRKARLAKVLNYLSEIRNLSKDRITFLISEADDERVYFQPLPNDSSPFDADFVIKGEYFNKFENLFQSKTVARNRKK